MLLLSSPHALQLFLAHAGSGEPGLVARHVAEVEQLCAAASGFAVRDLPAVCRILECTLRLAHNPESTSVFLPLACQLVRAVARPYTRRSAADELQLPAVLRRLLCTLAHAFEPGSATQLRTAAAAALTDFASAWGARPAPGGPASSTAATQAPRHDLRTAQRTHADHQQLLQESDIVPWVCAALQEAAAAIKATTPATTTTTSSSAGSADAQAAVASARATCSSLTAALLECCSLPALCKQQLQAGMLSTLATLLLAEAAAGLQGSLCSRITALLWTLLEQAGQAANDMAMAAATPEHQTVVMEAAAGSAPGVQQHSGVGQRSVADVLVEALAAVLERQSAAAATLPGKQERNDTLTVILHLSGCVAFLPAMASSARMLPLLLQAATSCAIVVATGADGGADGSANSTSTEAAVAAHHSMVMLAWHAVGNVAAASNAGLEAFLRAGMLRVLASAAAGGMPSTGSGTGRRLPGCAAARSTLASGAWWAQLAPEQQLGAQQLAWSVLQQVAPLCKAAFMEAGGIALLLDTLTECASSSAGGSSSGSAWLGTQPLAASGGGLSSQRSRGCSGSGGGSGGGTAGAAAALRLLRRLLQDDARVAAAVTASGGAAVLLQVLQAPAVATLGALRQSTLLALSQLCDAGGHGSRTAVREAGGVGVLLAACSSSILDGDPHLPSLAVLDSLWRCCLPSARSRAQLLATDGMDVLLSALRQGSPALQPVLLSMLADLLADARAHAFFWAWYAPAASGGWGSSSSSSFTVSCVRPLSGGGGPARAPVSAGGGPLEAARASIRDSGSSAAPWIISCWATSGADDDDGPACSSSSSDNAARTSSTQLLLSIWQGHAEALRLSGPDGVLVDPSCLPSLAPEAAAAAAPAALLAKVHACFAALDVAGTADASGLPEEGLRVLQRLPGEDTAVLALVQEYAALRQGQVWRGIRADLQAAGVEPTPEDAGRLESGIRHAEAVARQVQAVQAALLGVVATGRLAAERTLYDNHAAQLAADARSRAYVKDCSQLTMRERLAAKAEKEAMLLRARAAPGPGQQELSQVA